MRSIDAIKSVVGDIWNWITPRPKAFLAFSVNTEPVEGTRRQGASSRERTMVVRSRNINSDSKPSMETWNEDPTLRCTHLVVWICSARRLAGRRKRIKDTVDTLADRVFRLGGTIVHGSAPKIRDFLLAAAERFTKEANEPSVKAPLGLFVSRYYAKSLRENGIELDRWQELCGDGVEVTPEHLGINGQSEAELKSQSLRIMRQIMASRCNAIVAIGGKWWDLDPSKAGVPRGNPVRE